MDLILALDNIRSLQNVGAIFRTADGAGVSRLILGGLTATPPRHEIEKTALGATETVPWEYAADLARRLRTLAAEGYTLYALELTPVSVPVYTCQLKGPAVLVLGHEREGVQPDVLALCPTHLSLPMRGSSARSLNVAVAAGIAAYEFGRQLCYN